MMRFILLLTLVLFSSSAFAAAKVQEVTATNGFKAWLIEDHSLPVITLKIDFLGAGSAYDPQGKEGLANFATRLLDEGAGTMDSLAFNRALEQHAIRMNAEVTEDYTRVNLQTLSEFKGDAFAMLALSLNKARFDNDAVERVRADLISWLREVQENPIYVASLKWKELAFAGHPYARPKSGTLSTLSLIKREDLQQYGAHLACHNKIISLVGDITPAEASQLLATLFPLKQCTMNLTLLPQATLADGDKPVIVKKPVPQTVIQASMPAVMRDDARYYALVVLNQIFGGGTLTARLGEEIRIKRGLAYYAESDIEELDHAAYLGIHFATRSEEANSAVNVFYAELDKIRENGIKKQEVDDAKQYLTGSFPLNLDSQGALADYLMEMQRHRLGRDYLDTRNDKINAVTLEDVNALVKELFSHKPLVVMVGN